MRLNKENLPRTDGEWKHNSIRFQSMLNGEWKHNSIRFQSMLNGRTHNSLGPAIIYDDGGKEWYIDGKLHRLDGSAIEWADGSKYWYVAGKHVLEQDFPSAVISFLLSVNEEIAKLLEQELE